MKKYNNFKPKDLTFVVCAYGECQYLDTAINSLLNQTRKANIIISTSTNNKHINKVANKYKIDIHINPRPGQIEDYNFALKQANTKLVMLMHQDEILLETFVEDVIEKLNYSKEPIMSFTNYIEIHNNIVDKKPSTMVKIKRALLIPAKWNYLMRCRFGKRLIMRIGNPITHPTVVHVSAKLPDQPFRKKYKSSMDWDLWERLSTKKGSFTYIDKVLLYHRMDENNQTVKLLKTTNARYEDELEILKRFWPAPIAKLLMKAYSRSNKYY